MDCFKFGDLKIALDSIPVALTSDDTTTLFCCEEKDEAENVICIEGRVMDPTKFANIQSLHDIGSSELLKTPQGLFLMNHWATCRFAYGFWLDETKSGDRLPVYFNPELPEEYPLSRLHVMFTVGLHRKLMDRGAVVLHASYIDCGGSALLFTAPSGTGKSTQAELWRTHAGAQIINGDRVLLRQRDGVWHAFGYPCSGSSSICVNRTLPLRAIVVLEQHAENIVEEMSLPAKMRALVSATEVYTWNHEEIDCAFSLAGQIIAQVPVVKLRCRPDGQAVDCLKKYLEDQSDGNSF